MKNDSPAPYCRIFLRQIRFLCKIGIDPAEQEVPQHLLVDVEITPKTPPAGGAPAVDYAAVLFSLRAFANSKQHTLMETFAAEAAALLLAEFPAAAVRVSCCKPHPFSDLHEAGAEVFITDKD